MKHHLGGVYYTLSKVEKAEIVLKSEQLQAVHHTYV